MHIPKATPAGLDDFGQLGGLVEESPSLPPVPGFPDDTLSAEGSPVVPEVEVSGSFAVEMSGRGKAALLLDVTPRALGVATAGGYCDTIIERNAAIPIEQTRKFSTSYDGQTEVAIDIYQGESRRAADTTKLGQVVLSNLRAAARGEVKISVTFEIDTDGMLAVSALNEETGQAQKTRIVLSGGMDENLVNDLIEKYT
jgi:molecular chaperone DnaK